jgi:cytochrome c biogenesis protein
MNNTSKDRTVRVVVRKLSSIRLTVVLLFILAGVSIIGTLIPQDLQQVEYVQRYGFSLYKTLNLLGFLDIYHTWWFNSIIVLLAVNLIFCSIDRLPGVYKSVKHKRSDMTDSQFKTLPFYREIRIENSPDAVVKKLKEYFSGIGAQIINDSQESFLLFWEKGTISRFGPYITHLGIVVVLIGALIGSLYGFRANVNIVEGGSVDKVYDSRRGVELPLGFEVKCDDFTLEFYPGTERPKRYASDLKIIENGNVVAQKTIEVNTPLSYKGLTFYQSSYGPAAPPSFDITVANKKNGNSQHLILDLEQVEKVMDGISIAILDYTENYSGFGPAALVELRSGKDNEKRFPVFQNYKDFDDVHSTGNYKVVLNRILQPRLYYTGLQVTKDPGVNIVWLGSFIMTIGLLIAFLIYHRRIWIKLVNKNNKTTIMLGGFSFKNKLGFEREFSHIVTSIERLIQEVKK